MKAWIVAARTSIVRAWIARTHSWITASVRAGDRGADQLARRPVDDDRHVAQRRLDAVAAAALGEVRDELERVEPGLPRRLDRHADEGRLRIGVGRARQGAVVGLDVVAERHPDGQLALVVRLVGVELGSGGVADRVQAVGDPQPPVARIGRRPTARVEAVVLEPDVVERDLPADRRAGSRDPRPSSRRRGR